MVASALSRCLWIYILSNIEVQAHCVTFVDLIFKFFISDVFERPQVMARYVVDRVITVRTIGVVVNKREIVQVDGLILILIITRKV